MLVRDPHGMERRFDLLAPMIEKAVQHREGGSDIIFLPDEKLEKLWVIRHVITDFRSGETVTLQLNKKIPACRHLLPPQRLSK
jgi:hypothetical protein